MPPVLPVLPVPPELPELPEPEPEKVPEKETKPEPEPESALETEKRINPCVRAAGYSVIPGTGCKSYVYCIRSEVWFTYVCDEGTWFSERNSGCDSVRPDVC